MSKVMHTPVMNYLHIQLLLSKWMLTLKRHRSELDEIEHEMNEYAATRLNVLPATAGDMRHEKP